ncbi:MAG: DUF4251 domain-containing protein [Dysgonamonadaceae bacterium]|nr:DUF4251 domain-containing protein [Dysgonamonadaceae bacterium]
MNYKQTFIGLFIIFISFLFMACSTTKSSAEKVVESQQLAESIKDFKFKFNASYANPQNYKSIYLSPYYDVKVSPDTVEAYLPFYGRAYTAPLDSRDSGIKFVSTKFDYEIQKGRKKGNWLVEIHTEDTKRSYSLYFNLWENGKASLTVNHPDKQSISFQGTVIAATKEE